MLYWTDDETDTSTFSFLEMVVDFELYSGFRVQDPRAGIDTTWGRKGAIASTLWQCALKYSTGDLSKSHIKAVRFQALLPFGVGGKVMGLNKRPIFLMGRKTEELIAQNALALAGLDKKAEKVFCYSFIRLPKQVYGLPEQEQLVLLLQERQKGLVETRVKRRLHGKQTVS